jgi:hypothetical protein
VSDSNSNFSSSRESDKTVRTQVAYSYHKGSSEPITNTVTVNYSDSHAVTVDITISGDDSGIHITRTAHLPNNRWHITYSDSGAIRSTVGEVVANSTLSVLGHPTYVDCELGEAYRYMDGELISLNKYIDLGSDLPELASGENTITFDNTITELSVVPRWWQI